MSDGDKIEESRAIWDANAAAWDARIGGGGGMQTVLIAPVVERMLAIQPGERVLDVACGNGIFSRRLAELGANVVASDFSPKMIEFAQARRGDYDERIAYSVADATDEAQLLALAGESGARFDAAVCINALMDMPEIAPLFRTMSKMLKPDGRFVFTVMHPAFNGQEITMMTELPDYAEKPVYSIKVSRYLSNEVTMGLAISDQPRQQYYWHRPIHLLLNTAFENGLIMDRIEEPYFAADKPPTNPLAWANYDMPPILFVRLRPNNAVK